MDNRSPEGSDCLRRDERKVYRMNKDGGPAFPESYSGADAPHEGIGGGMSLRDWFAGLAMQGDLARSPTTTATVEAEWAYQIADAMLERRNE